MQINKLKRVPDIIKDSHHSFTYKWGKCVKPVGKGLPETLVK